jgi:hypothetical protein
LIVKRSASPTATTPTTTKKNFFTPCDDTRR